MKIVVIAYTGLIGTKLVKNLRERGHEVVAASPSSGVNTLLVRGLLKRSKALGSLLMSRMRHSGTTRQCWSFLKRQGITYLLQKPPQA
jgi:transposase